MIAEVLAETSRRLTSGSHSHWHCSDFISFRDGLRRGVGPPAKTPPLQPAPLPNRIEVIRVVTYHDFECLAPSPNVALHVSATGPSRLCHNLA
jgi:hypothetical protein